MTRSWPGLADDAARAGAQTSLAIAGVAVIGALLFDMLLLSRGLLVSFRDLLDSAGYDVRIVTATRDVAAGADCPRPTALAGRIAASAGGASGWRSCASATATLQ